MNSHKITSLVEVVGIILVITPIIGRHLDFIPFGTRNMMLIISLTFMLLGTIWKVVSEMNEDNDQ